MSLAKSVSAASASQSGRRFHARRRIERLVYGDFGSDNGAILTDLGEGGLGFKSVIPVSMDQAVLLKFKLPEESNRIEVNGEVAWINESRKGGGLRFVELSADARAQIREWIGVPPTPEPVAPKAGNGADSNSARESPAPERVEEAQISEVLAPTERAQGAGLSPEANEAPSAEEGAGEEVPADQAIFPEALQVLEFNVEVAAGPDSTEPLESAPPAAPSVFATSAADTSASESPRAGVTRTLELGPAISHAVSAAPARAARVPASDSKKFAPVQKHEQKQAPSNPDSSLPAANDQDLAVRGSFVGQPQKPVPSTTEWGKPLANHGDEWKPQARRASQALKIGIGAATGACLMLALVFSVPSLVTRVQATANARSGGSNFVSSPAFQVEVADLNNRRWILRSSGEAGWPFNDTSSLRETQPAAAARREFAKSFRSVDTNYDNTVQAPQPKLPRPGELALSRPHATQAGEPSALLVAPSIFDGITPPIGSMSDPLAASGPEAPGIVQTEVQSATRASALQAAVLVQRVAPIYPIDALRSHVQGDVLVNVTIGRDGVPRNLKAIKGEPRLIGAALAAIRQWQYRPATLAGQPIVTQAVVTVKFAVK